MLGRMAGYQRREVTWEEFLVQGEIYELGFSLDQFVWSNTLECPASFVPVKNERNWNERSIGWHEERSTRRSRL
jgi:hypothetical protein